MKRILYAAPCRSSNGVKKITRTNTPATASTASGVNQSSGERDSRTAIGSECVPAVMLLLLSGILAGHGQGPPETGQQRQYRNAFGDRGRPDTARRSPLLKHKRKQQGASDDEHEIERDEDLQPRE